MKAEDARRLKELERENAQLKRIVADQLLENQALREISKDAPIDCQVESARKSARMAMKTSRAR
jgi:hypothetical protein